MSITQTYYLAHKARAKLSREAAQPDHDLRLLVGHANLLDTLMLELADAEREQERWFNQSVRGASTQKDRHVQWAENIAEVPEDEYDSDSSSDDDFEEDEEEEDIVMTNTNASARRPVTSKISSVEEVEMEDDLEEDYEQLELVRTPSHANSPPTSPPELVDESDSSDDDSMPPSPPQAMLQLANGKEEDKTTEEEESLFDESYYLPRRNTPATSMVSAITVY